MTTRVDESAKRMNSHLVRITTGITLDDLRRGRISPVDAYEAQVRRWIVEPGRKLAAEYPSETDSDSPADCAADQVANYKGRATEEGETCEETCSQFRPAWVSPQY